MGHILLVEDDHLIGRSLVLGLEPEGFKVTVTPSLAEARRELERAVFDAILLDVNLPDGSGFQLCSEIRATDTRTPILVISARSDEESAVKGLTRGANDYIRKPVGIRELVARIRLATGRRRELGVGPLQVDAAARIATVSGRPLELNRRELDILCLLLENAGNLVTRERMLERLDKEATLSDRSLDPHVSRLRAKLKAAGAGGIRIVSEYGSGYRLEHEP